MSKEEIALILGENEGLGEDETKYRIFLIFQRTGGAVPSNKIEYFTEAQAVQDAKEAVEAALNFGFKQGAFIFFASDVDAYDYQVKEILLPYFKKVKETFDQYNTRHFQMGLYGPRNTCIQVCDAGYAAGCFVSDMSSGYSGNLGYPFPKSWIFDQFHTTTLGEGTDGEIEIDKVAASGYYIGESELIDYETFISNYIVETIKDKETIDYISTYKSPVELCSCFSDEQIQEIVKRLSIVDCFSPHYSFDDKVVKFAKNDYVQKGFKFYSADSFAEIHTAANNSWYRFRKNCKQEENMYRIPHRTIYDTLSSLIRFSSEELYFLFLRHVISSEKSYGMISLIMEPISLKDELKNELIRMADVVIKYDNTGMKAIK